MHWEELFRHQAAVQAGVLGIDQLPSLGCTSEHWWRARRTDRWEVVTRRVLRLLGTTISDEQRVHAAVLDAGGGAALHAGTALAWLGVRGFDLSQIHATRRRRTTNGQPTLAVIHRLRDLEDDDIVMVRGIPSVRPIRAVWSIASSFSATHDFEYGWRRVGRVLDDVHLLGGTTWDELHHSIDRLGRSGRAGTRIMRELAAKRKPGESPTESGNEDRFEEVLGKRRMEGLVRQVVVGGAQPIGRVDYRDDELPLVVEVNSKQFHSAPSDQTADENRYEALNHEGFTVGVVWDDDLWRDTAGVIELVSTARRNARSDQPSVLHTASCPWPFDPDRILIGRGARSLRG